MQRRRHLSARFGTSLTSHPSWTWSFQRPVSSRPGQDSARCRRCPCPQERKVPALSCCPHRLCRPRTVQMESRRHLPAPCCSNSPCRARSGPGSGTRPRIYKRGPHRKSWHGVRRGSPPRTRCRCLGSSAWGWPRLVLRRRPRLLGRSQRLQVQAGRPRAAQRQARSCCGAGLAPSWHPVRRTSCQERQSGARKRALRDRGGDCEVGA
mmetsp:Transcript_98014/g.258842  ORF Transcript_98014/g.258842 Transcript_98014/m.258842 type:complete len:208 (-) Transcript_98014:25-648(-)